MLSKIKAWHSLAIYKREEDYRIARIQLAMIEVYWAAGLVVIVMDVIWGDKSLSPLFLLTGLLQLLAAYFLVRGYLGISGFFSSGVYIFSITLFATFGQGIQDYVIMAYPLSILYAALVTQRRGVYLSTSLVSASLAWLIIGEDRGWLVIRPMIAPYWTHLIIVQVIVLVTVIAIYLLIGNREYGLAQIWRELSERKRIEQKLRESEAQVRAILNSVPDLLFRIRRDGVITDYHAPQRAELYAAPEDFLHKNIAETLPPDMVKNVMAAIQKSLAENCTCVIEYLLPINGETRYYEDRITPLNADEVLSVIREITERKQAEEALKESEKKLKEIFDNSLDNIFVMEACADGRFKINKINDALAKVLRTEKSNVEGKYVDEVLGKENSDPIVARFRECIEAQKSLQYEERADLPDGTRHYSTNLVPILNKEGRVIRFIGVSREISERKQMEEALAQSEKRFKSYVENAPNIITVIDRDARIKYLNRTEFDLPQDMFLGKRIFDFINPEQQKTVEDALRGVRESGQPVLYLTSAVVEGQVSWYDNHAARIDPLDALSDIVIISTNVTERKKAEETLVQNEEFIRNINNNLASGMVYQVLRFPDKSRKFTYLSESVQRLYGITPQQGIEDASLIYKRVHPQDRDRLIHEEEEAHAKRAVLKSEVRMFNPDGSIRWSSFVSNPKELENGVTCWDGVELDITERKLNEQLLQETNQQLKMRALENEQLHTELREQAIRDSLTGLYNRRYMSDVFDREFSRAAREGSPLSIIMLDLDELKTINDQYGHATGDAAIQFLGACLKNMIRAEDVACRYGGDEFTIVLAKTSSTYAFRRVEEWRQFLSTHLVEINAKPTVQVRFTAGIASYPEHAHSMEEIINYADIALYRGKARGRNCTLIFKP